MELLSAWGLWQPNAVPFVLHADWAVLNSPRSAQAVVVFQSWPQAYEAPDFPPRDARLHLGLLPGPYVGNLRRASIYVLGLNPGVGPHDYYGEYEVPAFRRSLLANLKQKFGSGRLPFLFLDPRFSWHGGFEWWHGKLAAVIDQLAKAWGTPFASARVRLARELASLELVPYHSKTFRDHGGWLRNLTSVALARAFAQGFVLPRLAPQAIDCLYTTLIEKKHLAPATVRQAGRILHAALGTAVRGGVIARNPCDATTLPRVPRYTPTILTTEQIAAYLADAYETATPAMFALYAVCLSSGLRLGEALALREEDIDLGRGVLRVQQRKNPKYGPPKSDRSRRTVLLGGEAINAIRRALLWKKEQKMRRGPKYRDSGLLFVGDRGRPLNPSNIRNRCHLPRLERLHLPHVRLHDLRHTNATHLVAAGVDIRTVADRLGHASASFTLSTYAHAALAAQQRAAEAGNDLVTRPGVLN